MTCNWKLWKRYLSGTYSIPFARTCLYSSVFVFGSSLRPLISQALPFAPILGNIIFREPNIFYSCCETFSFLSFYAAKWHSFTCFHSNWDYFFLQGISSNLYKWPLGLKDELIRNWQSKVNSPVTSQNKFLAQTQGILCELRQFHTNVCWDKMMGKHG